MRFAHCIPCADEKLPALRVIEEGAGKSFVFGLRHHVNLVFGDGKMPVSTDDRDGVARC